MSSRRHEPALAEALERALGDRASATVLLDDEVADLVRLAETLEASASDVAPSTEFRFVARQRLLVQMARSARPSQVQPMHRVRLWAGRFAAGLTALSFAGAAAASASASALPGDALYPVKQATEAVAVQLATADSARQDILLRQADTRLDETARLLEQGRDADAALATAQYDDTVARLDVAGTSPASEAVQSNLRTNQVRLSELLQTAPAPARPGLERALAATERSLDRSRASTSVPTAGVAPAATATSDQRHDDVAPDRATAEVETARPADADERGAGESHGSVSVAPRGRGVEHRAEAAPVDTDTAVEVPDSTPQVPAVGDSSGEPRGIAVSESRTNSHANQPPATSQPSRGIGPTMPKELRVTPRTEPAGGRGRN